MVQRGFYFGESTIFKRQSLDYFGDIIAGDNSDVVCMKLNRSDFERIPHFERKLQAKYQ